MDLDSVADELYELRPSDFTAARNARVAAARTAGDRKLAERIQALRRPTLSAWASNLLVRWRPEHVQPLIRLGEGLRQAHRDLDGEQLRELSRQQHTLVTALARQARQLAADAGQTVSESVEHEVEATLLAVLADPEAAKEWASARLSKPLTPPVGFTVAAPGAPPQRAPTPQADDGGRAPDRDQRRDTPRRTTQAAGQQRRQAEERRKKLAQARKDQTETERKAQTRETQLEDAEAQRQQAETQLQEAEDRVATLTRELDEAREHRRAAGAEVREARDRAREAGRAARQARSHADAAAARAERLDPDPQ
ncbi:hypothetical protein AB0D12_33040 [Streptomyces sp. NPDC048479]|uniref:hypothetical protein n=1 Tax=Streptomyces sp. NPDC048479 TaxID=3154725 RepID=UPI003439F51A